MLIFVLTAFVFPAAITGLFWDDWLGGLVYGGVIRMFIIQQSTFCLNSVAHYFGDQPYSERHSPRDNFVVSLLTGGEGFHNYHHEFPMDYRSGVRWYHYDPPKWSIWILSMLGFAWGLKRFPENEINMSRYQQMFSKLVRLKTTIDWGESIEQLPQLTWDQYVEKTQAGHVFILIDWVIYDVREFVNHHPGGSKLLLSMVGKDATSAFRGETYAHSQGAENLLARMRVAKIRNDQNERCRTTSKIPSL